MLLQLFVSYLIAEIANMRELTKRKWLSPMVWKSFRFFIILFANIFKPLFFILEKKNQNFSQFSEVDKTFYFLHILVNRNTQFHVIF